MDLPVAIRQWRTTKVKSHGAFHHRRTSLAKEGELAEIGSPHTTKNKLIFAFQRLS